MLETLGWRFLQQRCADARLCLSFKIVNNMVAVSLPDYIQPNPRTSRCGHSMSFCQLLTGTNYYKYSFFPLAIVHWNALPEDVVSSPNPDIFKAAVGKLSAIHSLYGTYVPYVKMVFCSVGVLLECN